MKRIDHATLLSSVVLASLGSACASDAPGGITAHIVFEASPEQPQPDRCRVGIRVGGLCVGHERGFGPSQHQPLTAAAVPELVGRLEIRALTEGATLATTILDIQPGADEEQLIREGGTWSLRGVPAGPSRPFRPRPSWARAPVRVSTARLRTRGVSTTSRSDRAR